MPMLQVMLQNSGDQLQSDPLPCALRHPWWICGRGWGGSPDCISGIAPNAPPPHAPPPARPSPRRPSPPTEGDEVAYVLRTKVGTTTPWLLESQIRWDVEPRTRLVGQYVDFNQWYQATDQSFCEFKAQHGRQA